MSTIALQRISTLDRRKLLAVVFALLMSVSYAIGVPPQWIGHMYVALGGIFFTVLLISWHV